MKTEEAKFATTQDDTLSKQGDKRNEFHAKKESVVGRAFPKKRSAAGDPFPDTVDVSVHRIARHSSDNVEIKSKKMKTIFYQKKFEERRKDIAKGVEKTARAEILNVEEGGFLETDGECSYTIKQSEIAANVDIASATKLFHLNLPQFGPYHINYSSNGRFLALGGRKGHVAALDWQTKKLLFETNVMEMVRDVQFLHTENLIAVAQRNYTYIYDKTGMELHCLKKLHAAHRLTFLPHHFLLVASTKKSWIHWMDASIGKMVKSTLTHSGPLDVMCQNPSNAIIHTGNHDGTVSLWSPNVEEPLARILAHYSAVQGMAVDSRGHYMYTTGLDRKLRVWDLRALKPIHAYTLPFGMSHVSVSEKGMVACAIGDTIQVFRDMTSGNIAEPYLVNRQSDSVSSLAFVPMEDVLGVGSAAGFTSLLVPGAGEANVDGLQLNVYETKKQKREREVKQLLDKLDPEMICLDPSAINRVNILALEEEQEKRKEVLWLKPSQIEFTPRHKMKGRGGGVKAAKTKEIVRGNARLQSNIERGKKEKEVFGAGNDEVENKDVLNRFKKKKT